MKTLLSPVSRLLLPLAALVSLSATAEAMVVAADSFSLTDGRTLGAAVSGTKTDIGDLTWNGGSQWVFRENGGNTYMGTNSGGNGSIALPFAFTDYSSLGSVATVSFSVAYRKQSDSWFGLGFSSAATGGNITTTGAVWLMVNVDTGIWSLRSNAPGDASLPTGSLSDAGVTFSTGSSVSYSYSISYDSSANRVDSIIINDVTVLSGYLLPEMPGSISSIAFFGQKPYNTVTGTQVDNFSLAVTPSVPESGSVALAFGVVAAAGLLVRGRRRKSGGLCGQSV